MTDTERIEARLDALTDIVKGLANALTAANARIAELETRERMLEALVRTHG